jgi:WhiB family transcriptional regulator, redox-sensing transcriptional regulator
MFFVTAAAERRSGVVSGSRRCAVTEIYREVYPLHGDVRAGLPMTSQSIAGGFDMSDAAFGFDVEEELRWQERALCAQTDPEAFFPEKGGSTREAKRICTTCAVRSECLEYALGNDERFGIWGGLSERERRRLKRKVS